jgi:hypothetical protein
VVVLAAALAALPPAAMAQQGLQATGRVVLGTGAPGTPLAGAWVTLHEVTVSGGGPIDSVRSDREGRFRVRVAATDTAALYMVSTAFRGITYFSEAILPRNWRDTIPPLEVYDTSSTTPPIGVEQRHVVVRRGGEGGGRAVLEIVTLMNRGDRTRISPDSAIPVWSGLLPRGAAAFLVGESDVSAEAVERRGDSVVVTAPIPPGRKQVVFTYTLPAGRTELAVPLDQPTERLLVLLEDTAATLTEGPLVRRGTEVFDETPFALFDGVVPAGGGQAVFRLSRPGITAQTLAVGVAALAAVLLVLAVPLLLRRRAVAAPVPVADDTPEALARAIAALDAAFEASDRSPAAEAAYRGRRAALKGRLTAALARKRPAPQ